MRQKGFTLLEVIVSLAIVGMALGSLFGLLANSKRLAFRAMANMDNTLYLRSAVSLAQAEETPRYPQFPEELAQHVEFKTEESLEKSKRQTQKILYELEPYNFKVDGQPLLEVDGLRWKALKKVQ